MILSGRIAVGGKTLVSPAYNVQEDDVSEETAITLDGHPLPPSLPLELYLFHKPREVLTARVDRSQRTCLPDLLPPSLARLKPVGRLDFLSEGLLLLTTSGELARRFELPQNALQRRYRLRLYGSQDEARARFEQLKRGITRRRTLSSPLRHLQKSSARCQILSSVSRPKECQRERQGARQKIQLLGRDDPTRRQKPRAQKDHANARLRSVAADSHALRTFRLGKTRQGAYRHVAEEELRTLTQDTILLRAFAADMA